MTQDKFREIVNEVREATGERCHLLILTWGAMCQCSDSPTFWFDGADETSASEWVHDHATH